MRRFQVPATPGLAQPPVPPQPAMERRRSPHRVLLRRLAAVALVTICVGAVLAACSGASPAASSVFYVGGQPLEAAKGQTVEADDVQFTLLEVECAASASLDSNLPGYAWVGFRMQIDNPSLEPWDRALGRPSAFSDSGKGRVAWEADPSLSSLPVAWQPILEYHPRISGNSTASGWWIFAVPTPQAGLSLRYLDRGLEVSWRTTCDL